jgi:hypothetical protein
MRHDRSNGPRHPHKGAPMPVFDPGQKVHDLHNDRAGEIVDIARQYANPTADPVHNYLVRWDDGHIEALNERALTPGWGLEVED